MPRYNRHGVSGKESEWRHLSRGEGDLPDADELVPVAGEEVFVVFMFVSFVCCFCFLFVVLLLFVVLSVCLFASDIMLSRNMLNNTGVHGQPCRTPVVVLNSTCLHIISLRSWHLGIGIRCSLSAIC